MSRAYTSALRNLTSLTGHSALFISTTIDHRGLITIGLIPAVALSLSKEVTGSDSA